MQQIPRGKMLKTQGNHSNDYYYDVQLPINHVISKTVLHLVAVCITSQKHSKHMLKVCRKFSKKV